MDTVNKRTLRQTKVEHLAHLLHWMDEGTNITKTLRVLILPPERGLEIEIMYPLVKHMT